MTNRHKPGEGRGMLRTRNDRGAADPSDIDAGLDARDAARAADAVRDDACGGYLPALRFGLQRGELGLHAYRFAWLETKHPTREPSIAIVRALARSTALPGYPGNDAVGLEMLAFGFYHGFRAGEAVASDLYAAASRFCRAKTLPETADACAALDELVEGEGTWWRVPAFVVDGSESEACVSRSQACGWTHRDDGAGHA